MSQTSTTPTAAQQQVATEKAAEKIVDKVLNNLVQDPNVNLTNATSKEIQHTVTKEITAVVMNQTNQEPWYQSRILLSQYMTLIVAALGVFGIVIEPEYAEIIIGVVVTVGSLVNPLTTLYARLFAKKPLTILGTSTGTGNR